MTGAEFKALRERRGLSIRKAAAVCGVAPHTIVRWEHDLGRITLAAAEALQHDPNDVALSENRHPTP